MISTQVGQIIITICALVGFAVALYSFWYLQTKDRTNINTSKTFPVLFGTVCVVMINLALQENTRAPPFNIKEPFRVISWKHWVPVITSIYMFAVSFNQRIEPTTLYVPLLITALACDDKIFQLVWSAYAIWDISKVWLYTIEVDDNEKQVYKEKKPSYHGDIIFCIAMSGLILLNLYKTIQGNEFAYMDVDSMSKNYEKGKFNTKDMYTSFGKNMHTFIGKKNVSKTLLHIAWYLKGPLAPGN